MFDEKEIEELCDEFLSLDGNVFLDSFDDMSKLDDCVLSNDVNRNLLKKLPNLKNNNFIGDTSGAGLIKSDANAQLDLINENSIRLNIRECINNSKNAEELGGSLENPVRAALLDKKENEFDNEYKEIDEKLTSPDASVGKNCFHRNGWVPDSLGLWRSGPSSLNLDQHCNDYSPLQDLTSSATYHSNEPQSVNTFLTSSKRIYSHQQLGAKVEMVYSLLSMLDMNNREDMSKTFLAMSSSPESCHAMRQSGCLPLLIQLIHSSELNREVRERAAEALHNIVHSQTEEKRRKREIRVLKLLHQVREYCDDLKNNRPQELLKFEEPEKHPINAIGTLMKFSFDAEHRQAICILGGLHAISELIQVDHEAHGNTTSESPCITLRRYAGMSLTNLTFGDCKNKALLCSFNKFMCALVDQLKSPCEDLRQVTASVLRNLSWRADSESKQALRDVGAVTALTISAMEGKKESTLKSILSALWNLSAHCSLNKIDICSVPGALAFLVKMLKYKSSSNTLAIVENAGGILRNISSHVAVREDYRQILRENNCFEVLLEQLKSPSLTIVSNACGTLWNLSARCPEDQRKLWEMGATNMLRSLVQSKHKMISMGSSAALKNLLAANPNENLLTHLDSTAKSLGLQNLPTLFVRKKRALEQELNITLAETCENIDSIESPTHMNGKVEVKKADGPKRSESRDSVQSTQSDSTYERINQISLKNEEKLLESNNVTLHDSLDEKSMPRKLEDQKLIRRYRNSMIPTPTFKKVNQDRINEKTREEHTQESTENGTVVKVDFKQNSNRDADERNKNGVSALNAKPRNLNIRNYEASHDECSSLNNFLSRSTDECSMSRECQENEKSQEADGIENVQTNSMTPEVIKSLPFEKSVTSNLIGERNRRMKSQSLVQNGLFTGNGIECKKTEKNKEGLESSGIDMPSVLNIEEDRGFLSAAACEGWKFDDKINEKKTREIETSELRLSYNNSLKSPENQYKLTECTRNNGKTAFDHLSSNLSTRVAHRFRGQKELSLKTDFLAKDSISGSPQQDAPHEMLPASGSASLDSRETSKVCPQDLSPSASNKMTKEDAEFASDFLLEETRDSCLHETKMLIRENRCEASGEASLVLLDRSLDPSPQSPSLVNLRDRGDQNLKMDRYDVVDFAQAEPRKPSTPYYSFIDSDGTDYMGTTKPTEMNFPLDSVENLFESSFNVRDKLEMPNVGNADGGRLKTSSNVVLPKFKVGSPITDSKSFQVEASKICREIKKHQDFEMGCSLNSEVSLVSCSSFIDTGDCSLFECSTDAVDFDDAENFDFGKMPSRHKNLSFRKPVTSQAAESVSLPSLGSLKNEQIESLDLDSSILSVASITSEIAETYTKDFDAFHTYTKSCKIDPRNEFLEDTAADATLVSNGDDTLNADSLQNNPEVFDEDNSLHSQENLPLDSETFEECASDQKKKKLTPKEKRKTFHERYRTYTIRDFNGPRSSELGSAIGCQDPNANLNEDCAHHIYPHQNIDNDFGYNNSAGKTEDGEEMQEFELSSETFCVRNKNETHLLSKQFTKAQDAIPGFVVDSNILKDMMNIGPAERKELVDNAKLVAFSLKTAVQDSEVMSDSETEDPHVQLDTATYNKSFRDCHLDRCSSQGYQCCQFYEEEDPEKKGARILKPNEKSNGKLELSKGVRGRRKPLYSSPQKHSPKTNGSPMSLPKITKMVTDASTKKSLSETCVTPILQREGTFTKEEGPASKKNEVKTARIIPVVHRNGESKNLNSARSESGNKSGPFSGNPRRVEENQVSKIGRPQSTYITKGNERRLEPDSSQRRSFSAEAGSRTGGDGPATGKKSTSTGVTSPKMKNSSSNQNVKLGSSPGSGLLARSKNSTLQNGKSQSDASLNLVACKDKGKQKTPRKEVTSKIASLWRKVEETKQKNKISKDSRVWITAEKNTGTTDEVLVVEQEEILDIPTRRIVHSLTCQALSVESSPNVSFQERNSRTAQEFAGSEGKNEKIERRTVISAVVPPFNYNPPISEKNTPLKIEQVEAFHKGSLKVTTA